MWSVPRHPLPPVEPPALTWCEGAFLTKFSQGPVHSYDQRPMRVMQGAVYDARGELVASSQKIGGVGTNRHLSADPRRVRLPRAPRTLSGTWLYGGHWNQHFGHFVTETITTLWPDPELMPPLDGLVFHQYFGLPFALEEWMSFLLTELGLGTLPVKVVGKQDGLAVERLAVPGRAVVAQAFAHPEARVVWERVSRRHRGPVQGGRVWLSRTRFHDELRRAGQESAKRIRTDPRHDRHLDELFASAGFDVVAPETLAMSDQVALVADADTIAGASGSALHLSAFARPGTRVLELGDDRNPDRPLAMQQLIAAASAQPHAFLPRAATDEDVLEALGLLT